MQILKVDENLVANFRKELARSSDISIDSFLNSRTEYKEIGKKLIGLILFGREHQNYMFNPADGTSNPSAKVREYSFNNNYYENNGKWYKLVFNSIDILKDLKNLSIITFNYDRSLEFFLSETFRARYGLSDNEIAEKMSDLQIIHVHGSLSKLKFQSKSNLDGIDYGFFIEHPEFISRIPEFIKDIKTAYESKTQFDECYELINSSERIIFLGFGFLQENMDLLKYNFQVQ